MANARDIFQKIGEFVRGPREPSAEEIANRTLVSHESKDLESYSTDLQLQYLTGIGIDFAPADIRSLQIRARWGSPEWLYSLYDQMVRLGPGPQVRKMIEAMRDTEDQFKTTPEDVEDADEAGLSQSEIDQAVEAAEYVEAVLRPWTAEIKSHMATAELYGVATGEIVTDPRGLKWRSGWKERIVEFRPIPARRLKLDPGSHEWLLKLSPLSMDGVPVDPLIKRGKLLFYEVGAGVEPLDQRGLYFQILLPWAILQYCTRWRAKRVEKYGIPPAIGKVNLSDAKQKATMLKALEDFGASMHMVVGKDSSVEFANALAQGRIDPQAEQIEWCLRQFDLTFLGDTQASQVQVGAGSKQSKDQAIAGFKDLTNSRILRLNRAVFNRQLIPGLILRNFGEDLARANCPTIESTVPESDDALTLAQTAVAVNQAGFGSKIDGEDLIRRCTLQIASEEMQSEAEAKEQAANAAKAPVLAAAPGAAPDDAAPGTADRKAPLPPAGVSPGARKPLPDPNKAPSRPSKVVPPPLPPGATKKAQTASASAQPVVPFVRRRFATMGDVQPPAAAPVLAKTDGARAAEKRIAEKVRAHLAAMRQRTLAERAKAISANARPQ